MMDPDTGFVKALSTLKLSASEADRKDLCYMLEESYAFMKRWNSKQMRLWVLRDKVFEPLQLAVESNDPRLCTAAVKCLQTFLHDERFKSCTEFLFESRWIPIQVLHTLGACNSFSEDGQMEVLKVLLDIALSSQWQLNANLLIKIIELCLRMADSFSIPRDSKLPPVASSTLNQILQTVVTNYHRLQPESFDLLISARMHTCYSTLPDLVMGQKEEDDQRCTSTESPTRTHSVHALRPGAESEADTLRQDVMTILEYLAMQCGTNGTRDQQPVSVYNSSRLPTVLSAIHTVLMHLPTGIVQFQTFTDFVWKDLCPALVSLMHSNLCNGSSNKKLPGPFQSPEFGRGSGVDSMNCAPSPEIYSTVCGIAMRLAHLVGPLIEMRPVLESLFHSFMLYPPPKQRVSALKAIQQFLASESELMRITLPCWHMVPKNTGSSTTTNEFVPVSDWACVSQPQSRIPVPFRLMCILLDSLAECSCSGDSALVHASVESMTTFVKTLERLSTGEHVPSWLVAHLVPQLTQLKRRDPVSEDEHSSSEIATPHNTDVTRTATFDSCHEHEQTARDFLAALLGQLPVWRELTSVEQLDRAILTFASQFCASVHNRHFPTANHLDNRGRTILNADAIYATTYAALALNWRLWAFGHYDKQSGSCKLTEADQHQKKFIDSVLNRKLLVYLPVSFLSEVYRLVTTRNYLQQGGFDLRSTQTTSQTLPGLSVLRVALDAYNGNCHDLESKRDWHSFLFDQPPALVGSTLAQIVLVIAWDALLWFIAGVFCTADVFDSRSRLHIVHLGEHAQLERRSLSKWVWLLPQSTTEDRPLLATAVFNTISLARACVGLASRLYRTDQVGQLLALVVHLVYASIQLTGETSPRDSVPDTPVSVTSKRSGLHAVQVLLLDTVLQCALDGLISESRGWLMVFRTCRLIAALEHQQFVTATHGLGSSSSRLQQSSYTDESCQNASQFLIRHFQSTSNTAVSPSGQNGVAPKFRESLIGSSGSVNVATAEHLFGLLRLSVDKLFQQIADRASLPDLLTFSTALLSASREPLFLPADSSVCSASQVVLAKLDPFGLNPLLDRLCQLLIDLTHQTNRPLLHFLYLWAAVSDQLIKVCHLRGWFLSDTNPPGPSPIGVTQPLVAQRVLDSMHTCILTVIASYPELPHFTVNEALCKPLENTIKLELCEPDLLDRLITCICALVESGCNYLRSAWKPLFSALRSLRLDAICSPSTEAKLASNASLSAQLGLFKRLKFALFQPRSPTAGDQTTDSVDGIRWIGSPRHRYSTCDTKPCRLVSVMEIFEVYLDTVNEDVFCDTVMDCLMCLIHFVALFHRTADNVTHHTPTTTSMLPKMSATNQADTSDVLDLSDEQPWCSLSSGATGSDDLSNMLFRTEVLGDNSQIVVTNDEDLHASTATMFLSALTCLIRLVYCLERIWSKPRVLPIKQARHQFELRWASVESSETHRADRSGHLQPELLSSLDLLDNGSGILFAYALIVHHLLDLVWTSGSVQRNLLLDTVLRLVRGASICFPHDTATYPQKKPDFTQDGPTSLTLILVNHLLLPQVRLWVETHVQPYGSVQLNKLDQSNVEQQQEQQHCRSNSEVFIRDSDPTAECVTMDQDLLAVTGDSNHVTTSIGLNLCEFCARQSRNLRFLRLTLGQVTELVMDCAALEAVGTDGVLEQFLAVLYLATISTDDSMCYLGPTCLRHILLTHGATLPEPYWSQLVHTLTRLLTATQDSTNRLFTPNPLAVGHTNACESHASNTELYHLRMVARQLFSDPIRYGRINGVEQSQPVDKAVADEEATGCTSETAELRHGSTSHSPSVAGNLCPIVRSLISYELLIQTVVDLFVWRGLPEPCSPTQTNDGPYSPGPDDCDGLFGMFDQFLPNTAAVAHLDRLTVKQCLDILQCLCKRYTFCLQLHRNLDARVHLQRFIHTESKPDLLFQAVSTVTVALRILAYLILRHNVILDADGESPEALNVRDTTMADFLAQTEAILWPLNSSDSLSLNGDWNVLRGLFTCWFQQLIMGSTLSPEDDKELLHFQSDQTPNGDNNETVTKLANSSLELDIVTETPNAYNNKTNVLSHHSEVNQLNVAFAKALARFMTWLMELLRFLRSLGSVQSHGPTSAKPLQFSYVASSKHPCDVNCWCTSDLGSYIERVVAAFQNPCCVSRLHLLPKQR